MDDLQLQWTHQSDKENNKSMYVIRWSIGSYEKLVWEKSGTLKSSKGPQFTDKP